MRPPDQSVVSVLALDVSTGKERELLSLMGQIQVLIQRKGYGTSQLLRDGTEPQRYYDIRIWRNAATAAQAQSDAELKTLWQRLARSLRATPLVDLAWAVEAGLTAAGPWPERRIGRNRRSGRERRVQDHGRAEGERRGKFDRRQGPRRADEGRGETIVAVARIARERSHASFSGLRVGAALETAAGLLVTGCNVENATYGLTICAERLAMFKALSEGHQAFTRIAIVTDTLRPTPPCGACRQILWEFGGDLEVILADLHQVRGRHRLKDLLPLPFEAGLLKDRSQER